MQFRSQPFTTISIAGVLVLAYLWVAGTLGLPFGKFAFWLLAPTTWWGYTSFVLFWLGWLALTQLAYRERTRKRQRVNPVGALEGRTVSEKIAILVIGGVLVATGLIFGEVAFLPGFCNTPSGYCIDVVPSIRAVISGGGGGLISGTGGFLIGRTVLLWRRQPANREKPKTFLDLQRD
ncbi:hypothetical protein AUF78_10560 [archaeon 13_1_20CM_2_51_12]|nr:MAG: hypothetical protein AUF78_10560 [archaeon 13_1_20CM_2_51_12]